MNSWSAFHKFWFSISGSNPAERPRYCADDTHRRLRPRLLADSMTGPGNKWKDNGQTLQLSGLWHKHHQASTLSMCEIRAICVVLKNKNLLYVLVLKDIDIPDAVSFQRRTKRGRYHPWKDLRDIRDLKVPKTQSSTLALSFLI